MNDEHGAAKGAPGARVGVVHITDDEPDGARASEIESGAGSMEWRRWSLPMVAIAVVVILGMAAVLGFMLWGAFHAAATVMLPLYR